MVDSARSRGPRRELGALGDGAVAPPRPDALASDGDAKPPAAAQPAQRAEPAPSGGQSVQITARALRFAGSTI